MSDEEERGVEPTGEEIPGILGISISDSFWLQEESKLRLNGHEDEVWFVQFSPNGLYLASGSKEKTVRVWDVARALSGEDSLKWVLSGHEGPVKYLDWSPDSAQILSCGADSTVILWDVASDVDIDVGQRKKKAFDNIPKHVMACVWMPDGESFIVAGSDVITRRNAESGDIITTYGNSNSNNVSYTTDVAVTADGKRLFVCTLEGTVRIYGIESAGIISTISVSSVVTTCSLGKADRFLFLSFAKNLNFEGAQDAEIQIWDLDNLLKEKHKEFTGFKQRNYIIRGSLGGADESIVVSGSEDNLVYVWERPTGQLLAKLEGHSAGVNCVHWNPTNHKLFASGSDDHSVILWGAEE